MSGFVPTAVAGVLFLSSTLAASPASACLRIYEASFTALETEPAEPAAIAGFIDVPSWGSRQRVAVRVSAPDHDLAKRRALRLADLLQANGLMASGILIETERSEREKAVLIIYPPPIIIPDPRFTQAAPAPAPAPRSSCGG